MADIPTYAVMPSRDRHGWVEALCSRLADESVRSLVILDNGSDPPLFDGGGWIGFHGTKACIHIDVISDPAQPPNLAHFWNQLFDRCEKLASEAGAERWNVIVLNDDSLVPAGWVQTVTTALREHPTAAAVHTGTAGRTIIKPHLLLVLDNHMSTRMCPHAFVVRGELGLRADESMHWWYFDTDFDWQCRLHGGVLGTPGPRVANALANSSTVGELAEQAKRDEATFMAKWEIPVALLP